MAPAAQAVGPGGRDGGEVEEEGVAGAGGKGREGVAEGVIVADEQMSVLWDARVEPAALVEEEVAGGAAVGRHIKCQQ